MDVRFEISDRYYEELGPWPLALGETARAQLYAFRDHSPEQHGGRLLLPDMALAPSQASPALRPIGALSSAYCGLVGALRSRRSNGSERRDETTLRLECGVPICLVLRTRRWDHVDLAPAEPPPGIAAWRAARPPRVADLVCGLIELQEAAFEVGGVSSFSLLDPQAPDYPVRGMVRSLERLDLDPGSPDFGRLVQVERVPDGLFWPHRYLVSLGV